MIVIIDNYDSFTYNLYQMIREGGADVSVYRNDEITPREVFSLTPDLIVLSPGPGRPESAGVCVDLIRQLPVETPLLGVCLGHQCIATAFGGAVVRANKLFHGKTSRIHHDGSGIYRGMNTPFVATRYHSLVAERTNLPDELLVNAWTEDDVVMGMRHRERPLHGVQFHPESIMTEIGPQLLSSIRERV